MANAIPRQSRDDFLADLLLEAGFGEGVKFDHLRNRWLVWNGVRWHADLKREVYDLARQKAATLWQASNDDEGDTRKMLSAIFDTSKKDGVFKSLSAREGIAMSGNEWDRDPYLLGFENGILDLRTGEFDKHPSPETLVSKSVGIAWDPDAPVDEFENFLISIFDGDEELIAYMLRLLGYSMFGLQSEQKFWMWVGRGSNGKGILARTMAHCLGEYADTPSDTLYMRTRFGAARSDAARPDLLRLQGVRFTYMSEPPGGHFNEELLKAHTGEDAILARNLYAKSEQMAQFPPTHKIVFLTNDPPKTDDVGISMRRRARMVMFDQDFTGDRADMGIEERVKAQKQGILVLLAQAAKAWWNGGHPGLVEPARVTEWSKEYIESNDPLAAFRQQRCVVGNHEVGSSSALWDQYLDWAATTNEEPMSRTGFGMAMGRRFQSVRRSSGIFYLGIRAKSAVEDAESADD